MGEPNPYRIEGPALLSFSGGRTSGKLLKHIVEAHDGVLPKNVHVGFANTGDEDPLTLDFVQECSERWGVPIEWVEFDPTAEHKTRIVNHNSASRNGEPLDAAIATRPTAHLYNPVSRYCTATTKLRRLQKLMHHWHGYASWTVVLGLRADEMRRVRAAEARRGRDRQYPVMPLAEAGVVNADVLAWWEKQPFQLRLPVTKAGATLRGNCVNCMAKHWTKLVQIMRDDPASADRMIRREDEMRERTASVPYSGSGIDARASFFKDGRSFRDLLAYAQSDKPIPEVRGEAVDCACTD